MLGKTVKCNECVSCILHVVVSEYEIGVIKISDIVIAVESERALSCALAGRLSTNERATAG